MAESSQVDREGPEVCLNRLRMVFGDDGIGEIFAIDRDELLRLAISWRLFNLGVPLCTAKLALGLVDNWSRCPRYVGAAFRLDGDGTEQILPLATDGPGCGDLYPEQDAQIVVDTNQLRGWLTGRMNDCS